MKIHNSPKVFQVGKEYRLSCVAEGSRPAPKITWTIGRQIMEAFKVRTFNVLISSDKYPDVIYIWKHRFYFVYSLRLYSQEYIREGIDTTKSVIKFRPQRADNGKTITCKAENPKMRSSSIEDSILLSISCEYLNGDSLIVTIYYYIYEKILITLNIVVIKCNGYNYTINFRSAGPAT